MAVKKKTATLEIPEAFEVIADSRDREAWLEARRGGVTATEAARLVGGGVKTRRSILAEKEGKGRSFSNAHMKRGHAREPFIAEWVHRKFGIAPSTSLIRNLKHPERLATPDGLGRRGETLAVAEVKTTTEEWTNFPRRYMDQMLWQMLVSGAQLGLFVWEEGDTDPATGEWVPRDGFALEPQFKWIYPDEDRTRELIEAVDGFLAWRDVGAPLADESIPEDIDEAISRHVKARAAMAPLQAIEKEAEKTIRDWIAAEDVANVKLSGHDGALTFSTTTKPEEIRIQESVDIDAMREAHPEIVAAFTKSEPVTIPASSRTMLRITAHKKGDSDGE